MTDNTFTLMHALKYFVLWFLLIITAALIFTTVREAVENDYAPVPTEDVNYEPVLR